jgi:hypothetical protein
MRTILLIWLVASVPVGVFLGWILKGRKVADDLEN